MLLIMSAFLNMDIHRFYEKALLFLVMIILKKLSDSATQSKTFDTESQLKGIKENKVYNLDIFLQPT
jgi:KaiC/GvpD/RAD55 family RecA-like ATPase